MSSPERPEKRRPNVFEQLANEPPPPPPADFARRVHDRLNGRLLLVHSIDFVLRCLPYAMFQFGLAMLGWIVFTLRGRYPEKGNSYADRTDNHSDSDE